MMDDLRSQEYVLAGEQKIFGIKGGVEFSFEVYLHGHGLDTLAASQVAETGLSTLLGHCLGCTPTRTNSTTLAGGVHKCEALWRAGIDKAFFECDQQLLGHAVAAIARGGEHIAVLQHRDRVVHRDDLLQHLNRAHHSPP